MEEIIDELAFTVRWIPEEERNSKWYSGYLDKVNIDLKEKINL